MGAAATVRDSLQVGEYVVWCLVMEKRNMKRRFRKFSMKLHIDWCGIAHILFITAVSFLTQRWAGRRSPLKSAIATALLVSLGGPFLKSRCWQMFQRNRSVAPLTDSGPERQQAPARPPTLPTFQELQRLVPIAQAQRLSSGTLTLLSLESYADGAIIRGSLHQEQFRRLWPGFSWKVVDDTGRPLPAGPGGMSGTGGERWTFSVQLWQPVGEDARTLRVELETIEWMTAAMGKTREVVETERGPWVFLVDLTHGQQLEVNSGVE